MTPLHWEDASPKSAPHSSPQQQKGILGFIVGIMSGAAFSFFLMGLILGYAIHALGIV